MQDEGNHGAYKVTEVSFYHELQSLGRAGSVPSDHGTLGHYLANVGDVRV